jgi:hypothetical protein
VAQQPSFERHASENVSNVFSTCNRMFWITDIYSLDYDVDTRCEMLSHSINGECRRKQNEWLMTLAAIRLCHSMMGVSITLLNISMCGCCSSFIDFRWNMFAQNSHDLFILLLIALALGHCGAHHSWHVIHNLQFQERNGSHNRILNYTTTCFEDIQCCPFSSTFIWLTKLTENCKGTL